MNSPVIKLYSSQDKMSNQKIVKKFVQIDLHILSKKCIVYVNNYIIKGEAFEKRSNTQKPNRRFGKD